MPTTRYTTSTAIAYLLLGEGPMRLKNGLNSIYLNKTPLSNSSVTSATLGRDAVVYLNNTGGGLLLGFATVGIPGDFPILLKGAGKIATGSIAANSNVVTTTTSFFTSNMLASNSDGDGGLYQKVRIPGAGPGGSELAAEVLTIVSPTQAVIDRTSVFAATSVQVTWDHFSYARELQSFGNNIIALSVPVPRTDLRNNPATAQSTWLPILATMGNGSVGLSAGSTDMNFKNVKVNFRPGTLDQEPVQNSSGFSSVASGTVFNLPISQVGSIPNGGSPINIHNNKTTIWWSVRRPVEDIRPVAPASQTLITTGSGSTGLNIANPSEVDEIAINISFPQGLYGYKGETDSYSTTGVVFQIYFDYKISAAADYQSKLIYGPSDSEVATRAIGYFVDQSGDLAPGWVTTGTIRDNNNSTFAQEFRFNVNEFKPFDDFRVRIIKLTPDGFSINGWTITADTVLSSVQAYINDRLTYPLSSYLALEFNANEFQGRFPDIAVHCYGIECDVPTNYVTREEASDGIAKYTRNSSGVITTTYVPWNGTFRRAYTNNPVWIVRELLLNKRYGLGNWLTKQQINDYALYSLARYADDLVPDGEGGFEPRFTCFAYLTVSTEAYKVIKDFFTTVLAIPYWIDGQLLAVADRPANPVYIFSKANIEGGVFSYEGTGNKVRPNQVAVSYNDKNYFYEQRVEIVDDIDDIISTNRVITEEVVAFGATTRGQATRYGRWKMLTGKLQKDIISFKTAENAIFLKPGDVIGVQDADRYRVRNSGRVVSSTINSITIDKGVEIVSGETYEIHALIPGPASYLAQATAVIDSVTYNFGQQVPVFTRDEAMNLVDDDGNEVMVQFSPDMHLETRTITNTAGLNQTTINVSSAFSSEPISEFMWAITSKNSDGSVIAGSTKEYRILGITEEEGGLYGIVAAEHYNFKFDLVNEDYLLEPLTEAPRYGDIPAPRDFTAGVQLSQGGSDSANSQIVAKINLSWKIPTRIIAGIEQPVTNLDSFVLKYTTPDGNLMQVTIPSSSTSYVINNPSFGIYAFSLQSKSDQGPVSRPVTAEVTVQLDNITPGLAAQLKLLQGGEFTRPPIIDSNVVEMPTDYDYTSPIGTKVRVRGGTI